MKIHVHSFTFNPFQENTYIVYSENQDAVIIDPGCSTKEEELELSNFIADHQLNILALLNTHAHIDHILGNAFVMDTYGVEFYLHPLDLPTLQSGVQSANLFGLSNYIESPLPTQTLSDKEHLCFGGIEFDVFFTPGHAPGHVVFYNATNQFVINGDVLFHGSFGRVDLPGGDLQTLKNSIFNVLFKLPEMTTVYCGHGQETSILHEKKTNYILNF